MKISKNGFELVVEGSTVEISNKYGVFLREKIDISGNLEEVAESKLDNFIDSHSIKDYEGLVKKIAFTDTQKYIQLQAVNVCDVIWAVQKYDEEFLYMGETWVKCDTDTELKKWMKEKYNVVSGLMTYVLRNEFGDSTNSGITKERRRIYIVEKGKGNYPIEPRDLRDCVEIEVLEHFGEVNMVAKPIYAPNKRYMNGGNFIYSTDSRYKELTGIGYPIPVYDRSEN